MTNKQLKKTKSEFFKILEGSVIIFPKAYIEDAKKFGFGTLIDMKFIKDVGIVKKGLWDWIEMKLKEGE